MGFFLSILYFITDYLTPPTIFGPLAAYRIELIFAILLTLISIPSVIGSMLGKTPQTLALAGLAFATVISSVVSVQWLGGGVSAFMLFVPNAFAYFLVCLHCNTKRRLQILVLMMLFVCLFVIGQGALGLYRGLPTPNPDDPRAVNMDESYFFAMSNSAGEWFYRLRGMGEIHDPNDFSQLIVCVLPLVFIFWKQRRTIRNIFFVILPVCILLWGAYLTHSRGSLLALLAVGIVAARRRIGTIPSLILAGVLFAGATALNYTGGRDISANAGEDRTELWSESMQIFKAHPFFGIGFGDLPEYLEHTAHNTVLVCAAELGLFGLFFWSLFLFPTLRDALVIASPGKVEEGQQPIVPEKTFSPYQQPMRKVELLDKEEINRLGRLMVLSLTGFLVAGWFLSRAYVLTLFLLGGMTEVIFEMALQRGMISPRLPVPRVLRYSGVMTVSLVVMMYIVLRILNLTR
jgi:O-antigen ligase